MRRRLLLGLSLLWTAAGCTGLDFKSSTPLVASNPFDTRPAPPTAHVACAPGTAEVATRVSRVGQALLTANPQIVAKPAFITAGLPQAEIFHQGVASVTVTEGLVKQCASDAQLAAVLSLELGKLASEREVRAGLHRNRPEPMSVHLGNDFGSTQYSPDKTELAERLKLDGDRANVDTPLPPADPQVLARGYLVKAGYTAEDLNAVLPFLHVAEANNQLEKQVTGSAKP